MQQQAKPDIANYNLTEVQVMQNEYMFHSLGHISIGCDNINNTGACIIKAGSSVEVNGLGYKSSTAETPTGTPTNNAQNYVYVSSAGALSYSAIAPSWDAARCGWYDGTSRAIMKFFYTSSQYNGKVILDSYNAMSKINTDQPVPTTGGMLNPTEVPVNDSAIITLQRGAYRIEVRGGKGGKGGAIGYGTQGEGADGQLITNNIFAEQETVINASVGGDGADGQGSSGTTNGAGCSGGNTGGLSYCTGPLIELLAFGGSGAGGQGGYDGTAGGGGGGAGGYGAATNGPSGYSGGSGGGGGSNFNGGWGGGGAGGGGRDGGSGSGFVSSYGQPGGNDSSTNPEGIGSDSLKIYPDIIYNRKIVNAFQGAGAGGSGTDERGKNGPVGLKTTSSGYVRIYRMW
ncbi:hypothetical protein AGMMS49940_05860 [Spirochaetia bacterium]|nr:hypothetical protein AGMMS49940_05860 [Spirochaetia bacterium]